MTDKVCASPGCWTYTHGDQRYCLACQLDRDMPQPRLNRMGRPTRADRLIRHIVMCDLALEECETCEWALMMAPEHKAHQRLDQALQMLKEKQHGRN